MNSVSDGLFYNRITVERFTLPIPVVLVCY